MSSVDNKPSRNEEEYFARENAERVKELRAKLDASRADAERQSHLGRCPRCGGHLEEKKRHNLTIDVCQECGGTWLDKGELEPTSVVELVKAHGANPWIGAFAALASYALFHMVTVFPLSWIQLYSDQSIVQFLLVQIVGGVLAAIGIVASGWIADRAGRRRTLGSLAVLIAVFSGFTPTLLAGGKLGQDVFILVGFILLGLSYGQSSGTVTSNFSARYRYTGAAVTSDLAWLIGAAFAPLVALGLSAKFGLGYVSVYLLSGAACTLAALKINQAIETRHA